MMRRSIKLIVPRDAGMSRSLQGNVHPSPSLGAWPEDPPLELRNRDVVDARLAAAHEPVLVKLPQLVAVAAPPLIIAVAALVLEAHRDPVLMEGPQALTQRVVELALPFLGEKGDDGGPASEELVAIAPHGILGIGAGHALRITGIPRILGGLHLLGGRLGCERGQRRSVGHGSSLGG